jgi:PAS domain S-box-containing protein
MNTEQVIKILLVDDRKEDLLSLEIILAQPNYSFSKAASGRDALRILLKEQDFALILIDVQMPLLDGFETAQLIRESEKVKHIPIIFLTANDDRPNNIFKGYKAGAVDFMIKPLIPEIIRAKVSVFAELYKKNNELQAQKYSLLTLNMELEWRTKDLEKQQNLYRTLLETESEMGEGVLIIEAEKIIYVNDAVCRIYGYNREEILQLPSFYSIVPDKEKSELSEKIQQQVNGEREQSSGETQIIRKNEEVIDIEYIARNIRVDGRLQTLMIIRDITEKKHNEEQLRIQKERAETAEIAKRIGEQFLANMSHEIRTPMNAIVGFTDIMLKTTLTQEQNQYLDAIKMSGDNLLVIINDILDFSRMKSGKIPIQKRGFRLSQIISMCTELMLPKATEKGIKLFTHIDKNIPDNLIGDATRLNQVLLNLTANAIKFTSVGEVVIYVALLSENKDEVEIEFKVEDTGIGIPKDKLDTIFEAFTQANSNTARRYGGTGLGLTIVRQLAELQGASIDVTSEVGKGSCFYFRIKYRKNTAPLQEPPISQNNKGKNIKELNVLLVEDNAMNQILAKKVLSDWGWKIDVSKNGIEAIEKLKDKSFDIVLMDIQMPEMDGYEATLHIRNKFPAPKCNIPIMAMTAHVMPTEEEKCYKAGMNGYISKPFDTETLYSKIESILESVNNKSY